jgi:hypothetical protein
MTEKCWKRAERRIAELLGGRRVPVSGRMRGTAPDVEHEFLSIEVKTRKSFPDWLEDAMQQAEASAKDGQVAVVVLHQRGQRYRDGLVVMRLKDLETTGLNETGSRAGRTWEPAGLKTRHGETGGESVSPDVLVQWAVLEVLLSCAWAPLLQSPTASSGSAFAIDVHEYHLHTEITD